MVVDYAVTKSETWYYHAVMQSHPIFADDKVRHRGVGVTMAWLVTYRYGRSQSTATPLFQVCI